MDLVYSLLGKRTFLFVFYAYFTILANFAALIYKSYNYLIINPFIRTPTQQFGCQLSLFLFQGF